MLLWENLGYALVRRRAQWFHHRFIHAANHCAQTQQNRLARILRLNATSVWHREHGIRHSGHDLLTCFRRQVPIGNYDRFVDYIDLLKAGDTAALLGRRNFLLMFALSSGTTGATKYIPVTNRFLADYRRGWMIWGLNAFDAIGGMSGLSIFQLASDFEKRHTNAGTPCGNISGLAQHLQSRFVQFKYSVRPPVLKISDSAARYYTALRLGLADANVGVVMTANPSTLVHLAQQADAEKESLIRDIHDGTLTGCHEVPPAIRARLAPQVARPAPQRAKDLEVSVTRHGRLWPGDVWPKLRLVGVWVGGSAGAYLPKLRPMYGHVPIRDHGLSASEGRMTIPFEDESASGLLDVTSHFFEFIPEAEIDSSDPNVLLAHELEVGQTYYILMTTVSGLYRYDIHDVVRCTGFVGTTPTLEFLHKGAHVSSISGEKITESQVVTAVRRACDRLQLRLSYFTLAPVWGNPPAYHLLVERSDLPNARLSQILAETVDRELRIANCEYDEKRAGRRLERIACSLLPPGTWAALIARHQSRSGGSLEQYKHPCLQPDLGYRDSLIALVTRNARPDYRAAS